jgi:hypothetical protein
MVARYREAAPHLDRALQGVSDSVKIDALRVMVNLGISPNDTTNVLVSLYGHIRAAGEVIPDEIRLASGEFSTLLQHFIEAAQVFPDIVARVHKNVAEDVKEEAETLARAAVRAAGIDETDKTRARIALVAEESLKQFLENALKERSLLANSNLARRDRTVTAALAGALMLAGWCGGASWGFFHGHLNAEQQRQVSYGKEFIQMYPQLPDDMRNWVVRWVKRNPIDP